MSPGAGSCPRVVCERGEEPIEAAWRELKEETGLGEADVSLVSSIRSGLPTSGRRTCSRDHGRDGKRRGQVHKWFLFDALRRRHHTDARWQ